MLQQFVSVIFTLEHFNYLLVVMNSLYDNIFADKLINPFAMSY